MKRTHSNAWPATLTIGTSLACLATATTVLPGDHGILEALGTRVADPVWASLILLLLSLMTLWRRQWLASITAALGALVCAGVSLLESGAAAPGVSFWSSWSVTLTLMSGALASANLTMAAAQRARRRFQVFSSVLSMVSAWYVVLLAQIGGFSRGYGELPPADLSHLIAFGLVLTIFHFYRNDLQRQRAAQALIWMTVPIAVTGATAVVGITVSIWLATDLSTSQQWTWTLFFVVLFVYATVVKISNLRLRAGKLELERRTKKLTRLTASMRECIKSRTVRLRQAEQRYRALFDNICAPVFITSPSGAIVSANPAMRELLGFESEAEVQAANFAEFYENPMDRQKFIEDWHNSGVDQHKGEVKLRRKDGSALYVLFATALIRSPSGEVEYHQGVFTDITRQKIAEQERQTMESSLRLSQKLESVGRLAAGVAHEINTPMQYIGDNVFYLKESFETLLEWRAQLNELIEADGAVTHEQLDELDDEHDVEDTVGAVPGALKRTGEGIQQVNAIVAAMKELAHPDSGAKGSTDLNAIIRNAVVMTRSEYKTVAEIELSLGSVRPILAHKNELAQVFINMIVNAAHAIAGVQGRPAKSGLISIATLQEQDDEVTVRIRDNGSGIPAAVINKIFDPFFTTKSIGKGTGQGLAIARATIVDRHSGSIDIDSEVGKGTTFTIKLPVDNGSSTANPISQEDQDEN